MYEYRKLSDEERRLLLHERRQRGHPLHSPPHAYEEGGWFLISAAVYEHRRLLNEETERAWVLSDLFTELRAANVEVSAWVVLPNHYHLLLRCNALSELSTPLGRTHGRTSRELNRRDETTGRQVWCRFTDRRIRNTDHYYTTLNYIHHNPVKHGLTDHPLQWDCSSFGWYLEHWGADALDTLWGTYPLRSYGKGWDD